MFQRLRWLAELKARMNYYYLSLSVFRLIFFFI